MSSTLVSRANRYMLRSTPHLNTLAARPPTAKDTRGKVSPDLRIWKMGPIHPKVQRESLGGSKRINYCDGALPITRVGSSPKLSSMSIRERILTLMIGDGCPLLGVNPTSLLHRGSDANDPGCVKTCASRGCAELFYPFSSFDCDCQCCSFPIQRNRDKISPRKFDAGVFTRPGPKGDLGADCAFEHHACAIDN